MHKYVANLQHNARALLDAAYADACKRHPLPWRNRGHALCVLLEEVWEVVWALLRGDKENLVTELTHVSAVCRRWVEREVGR